MDSLQNIHTSNHNNLDVLLPYSGSSGEKGRLVASPNSTYYRNDTWNHIKNNPCTHRLF